MYHKLTQVDLEALKGLTDHLLIGDRIEEEYSHDELSGRRAMPEAVVKASSAEEISRVMAYANSHLIPVTPRGSGTGLVGAAVPLYGGIVLDMSGMNRVLELDEDNLTVTVEPGVLLMDLAEYVESRGFFYPPDPGEKSATIGGNISTNAGGMRAVKYGVTRDYVRGLQAVLPTGEIVEIGGKMVKNSSGYALKDLLVGSEGTLAVITRATLKLLPLPERVLSLLVPFPTLQMAIDTVPSIIRSKVTPTAVEFIAEEVIKSAETYLGVSFPVKGSEGYLLLRFDGTTDEALERDYDYIARLCLEHGAKDAYILDTEERNGVVWKARGAFLEAIKMSTTEMDEVDVVVPRKSVNTMVAYLKDVEKEAEIRLRYFGHAGDGNLHIYVLRDELAEDDWKERLNKAMELLYAKARKLGGAVSGEHGIGYAKMPYLKDSVAPVLMDRMAGIKTVFDPNGILNPGKVCWKE